MYNNINNNIYIYGWIDSRLECSDEEEEEKKILYIIIIIIE